MPKLDDDLWEDLLILLDEKRVIPVIGSGVVMRGDDEAALYPWLARRLAERLGIPKDKLPAEPDLNSVATVYLLNRGNANELYAKLARILREECPPPGRALMDLAKVSAFDLFLTTTFDPLLQHAVNTVRYGGSSGATVLAFAPGEKAEDLPARRSELSNTCIFHLLGRVQPMPRYVAWEEDLLEFMFALNRQMPNMERLGRDLKEHGLLFLGLHFSDWMVRFFLRVSRQEPLSTSKAPRAYLTDGPGEYAPESMVLFFGAVSRDINVVNQDPVDFCAELARRWQARHPATSTASQMLRLPAAPKEMPRGAIFLSYAREDEAAAAALVRGLQEAGCAVWYDRERLQAGETWHNSLEDQVKRRCGLFLSVISRTTEGARESYYHLERNWAAARSQRLAEGEEFYIPVVIDDSPLTSLREPRTFHGKQSVRLPGGVVTQEFVQRLLELQQKVSGVTS